MTIKLRNFYETGQKINDDPMVYVFEDFLQPLEIEQLLVAAQFKLKNARLDTQEASIESSNCWISHGYNQVIEDLSLRIAEVVGISLENAESIQVVHYGENQEYASHFDAWDSGTEKGRQYMAKGGQRMITCLLYLNDVTKGGETVFSGLNMAVRARKGRMLLFHNCHKDSNNRHPNSLHAELPVEKGEKWSCNFWFREDSLKSPKPTSTRKVVPPPKFKRII